MSILSAALLSFLLQATPIQGIVLNKGTGEPLSRVNVELQLDQENGGILDIATTEDDGRFSFSAIAPGRYRLTATRRGYTRPPMTITLASGPSPEDIRLFMTASAAISGRVVDLSGRALGNVEVHALKASYPEGRRVLTSIQSVQTNDLGEYRLFWLAPGRYFVAAVHRKARVLFPRKAGPGLGTTASEAVTLLNTDPALVSDWRELQSATERYAPIFFGGTTDEQKATGIDLREGAEFGAVDMVVGPVQMRRVRGSVVDGLTGTPAQYISIGLPKDLDNPGTRTITLDRERGTFDLELFPGSYALTATSASGEGYATFTLGDADIDNLTIPTTPTFTIRGRIAVEGTAIGPAALEALRITTRRDPPPADTAAAVYDSPLADGSFSISASRGDFRIHIAPILNVIPSASAPPEALRNAYVKSIRLANADVLNAGLRLDRPPAATLEVVIASNPGALQGQALRNGTVPLADVTVLLMPDNRHRTELYRTTTTDSAGRFHFDRIAPGNYKVFSWEEVEDGAWFDAEFMQPVESRGLPVRIGESVTESVRVEVIRNP